MSESNLKHQCLRIIKRLNLPNFWYYFPMDSNRAGIPDLIFCANGVFGWVEFKSLKGRVSPIQAFTHKALSAAGARGIVCRDGISFTDFLMRFYKTKGAE